MNQQALLIPNQVETEEQLINLFIRQKGSPHTRRNYTRWLDRFYDFMEGRSIREVQLAHIFDYADCLSELAPGSQVFALNVVKSFFTFASKLGYVQFNVAAAYTPPKVKNVLAERILSEGEVQKLIYREDHPRNHTILRTLYNGGLRAAELCQLKWKDLQERNGHGLLTVFGKGNQTRMILLSTETYQTIMALQKIDDWRQMPIFQSRKGRGHLNPATIHRIVKKAALRALPKEKAKLISPHWLRHAHASHALDRGCPIHLVQTTLGHASLATTSKYTHAMTNDSSGLYLAI